MFLHQVEQRPPQVFISLYLEQRLLHKPSGHYILNKKNSISLHDITLEQNTVMQSGSLLQAMTTWIAEQAVVFEVTYLNDPDCHHDKVNAQREECPQEGQEVCAHVRQLRQGR